MAVLLQGFLLMLSMIAAIGAQNAFVLKQGLLRQSVFSVALICFCGDLILSTSGVFGVGSLLMSSPVLAHILALCGALFLFYYGWCAFMRMRQPEMLIAEENRHQNRSVLMQAAAVTFLNPHVYLDTVVIVGAAAVSFNTTQKAIFLCGCLCASALWFFGLAYGARLLSPLFARPVTWRILDGLIALIMWFIACSLLRYVFQAA